LLSGLNLLLCQRLLRGVCAECRNEHETSASKRDSHGERSAGDDSLGTCAKCGGSGYAGRVLLAEQLPSLEGELARSLWQAADSRSLARIAQSQGMCTLDKLTAEAARAGRVHANEVVRFGLD
ncbi:MAG: hypothetical protein ABI557_08665, partial [Aureliella sp.]